MLRSCQSPPFPVWLDSQTLPPLPHHCRNGGYTLCSHNKQNEKEERKKKPFQSACKEVFFLSINLYFTACNFTKIELLHRRLSKVLKKWRIYVEELFAAVIIELHLQKITFLHVSHMFRSWNHE